MKGHRNLSLLSIDQLWELHEQVGTLLAERINAEKVQLEERLAKLNRHVATDRKVLAASVQVGERRRRRKYPPVLPKFRNPSDTSQTWAGRGKQPRWLVTQLKAGKKIDDFLINRTKPKRAGGR